jgi:hypothetical protein
MLRQAQGEIFRSYFQLLLSDRDANRTVNAAGADSIEISDKSGNAARLTIDPNSGLPVKLSYAGPQGNIEETWADLRDVSGIKAPFKISVQQNGRKFADVTVEDIKTNTGATEEQLSKRQ